jgi:hypothetical protein
MREYDEYEQRMLDEDSEQRYRDQRERDLEWKEFQFKSAKRPTYINRKTGLVDRILSFLLGW